jgi:ABC-2 type transport system ATP-binding protein
MSAMKPAIETFELTKFFGKVAAVKKVNLRVNRGEIFGFLGPNGAGKTTTMRMLCCLLSPTEGTAEISGHNILKEPRKVKSIIGYVPEDSNIYTDFSARYNLELMARLYDVPRKIRKKKIDELLEVFELTGRENDRVSTFSKGMRRRLTIAAALVHNPEILFLDELTTGLDVQSARKIRDLIKQLNLEGVTVFLTTHRIEEAQELCGRIGIIDFGKLVVLDTLQNLKKLSGESEVLELVVPKDLPLLARSLTQMDCVRGISFDLSKNTVQVQTLDGDSTLPEIIDMAIRQNIKIQSVCKREPTLEDVFLRLTGRTLREEDHRTAREKEIPTHTLHHHISEARSVRK